jgi:hypothetical protein
VNVNESDEDKLAIALGFAGMFANGSERELLMYKDEWERHEEFRKTRKKRKKKL